MHLEIRGTGKERREGGEGREERRGSALHLVDGVVGGWTGGLPL